ncbi:unnamed protein product [Ambrosiozyma monospora]|uniref:Unnamed protein product n=1 Tax=Ambrosiozyma monospora TaxID=43982 RepID=A0A9W7DJQ8_AMBMO|nr:unnamed protein product [Ambrosiozyma monospora]
MRFSIPLIFLAAASSVFAVPVPAPSESDILSNDFSDVPTATGSYDNLAPSATSSDFALTPQEKSFLGDLLDEAISTSFQIFGASKRDLGDESEVSSSYSSSFSSSLSAVSASGVSSGIPTASSVTVATDDIQSKKSWLKGIATGLSVLGSVSGLVSGLFGSNNNNNSNNQKRDIGTIVPSASLSPSSTTIGDLSSATISTPSSAADSGIPIASSVTIATDDIQSKKSWLKGLATGLSVLGSVSGLVSGLFGSNNNNNNNNQKRDIGAIVPSASMTSASSTITNLSSATISAPSSAVNTGIPTVSSVTIATDDIQSKKSWLKGIATGLSILGSVSGLVSGLFGSNNNDNSNQKRQYTGDYAVTPVQMHKPSYIAVTFTA